MFRKLDSSLEGSSSSNDEMSLSSLGSGSSPPTSHSLGGRMSSFKLKLDDPCATSDEEEANVIRKMPPQKVKPKGKLLRVMRLGSEEGKSPTLAKKEKAGAGKLKKRITDPLLQLRAKPDSSTSFSGESSGNESTPGKMSETKFRKVRRAGKKLATSMELSGSPRSDLSMSFDSESPSDASPRKSPQRALDEFGDSTVGRRLATIHEPSDYNIASTSKETVEESERKKEKFKGTSSIISTAMDVEKEQSVTQKTKYKSMKRGTTGPGPFLSPPRKAKSKSLHTYFDSSLTTSAGGRRKQLEPAADQPGFSGGSFQPSGNSPERENPTTSKAGSSKKTKGSSVQELWKNVILSVMRKQKKTPMLPPVTQLTWFEKNQKGIPCTTRGLAWKRLEIIFDINHRETTMMGLIPRIQFYGVENDTRCLYRIEFLYAGRLVVGGRVSQYDEIKKEAIKLLQSEQTAGRRKKRPFRKGEAIRCEVGFTKEGNVQFVALGFKGWKGVIRDTTRKSRRPVELDMFSFENIILKDLRLGL